MRSCGLGRYDVHTVHSWVHVRGRTTIEMEVLDHCIPRHQTKRNRRNEIDQMNRNNKTGHLRQEDEEVY